MERISIALSLESILDRVKIPDKGRLLLAFSGGEDSLFLLYALSLMAHERTLALYINHNLRDEDELEREIALNSYNAKNLDIPFYTLSIPRGMIKEEAKKRNIGLEASARDIRYKMLDAFAIENKIDYILTAHHSDDQAETVLMRMMEHSPFWKWGGIREKDGIIIRPMLGIKKSEIKEVVALTGMKNAVDSTNSDTAFKRNYIRKNILPLMSDEEKRIIGNIASNVSAMRGRKASFISFSPCFVSFSRSEYLLLLENERENTLFSMFSILGETERLSRRFIREVDSMIEKGEKRCESNSYIIYFDKDIVKGYRKVEDFNVPYSGEETLLPLSLNFSFRHVDSLSLEIPLDILSQSIVRKNRSGDAILLCDGKRKISSLLKEMKIPYAIVLERDGEIVAFFSSFLGGRDRLALPLKGRKGRKVNIVSESEEDRG